MKPELQLGDHILIFDTIERKLVAYGVFYKQNEDGEVHTIVSYVPNGWIKYGKKYDKNFGFILLDNFSCLKIINTILKHYRHEL